MPLLAGTEPPIVTEDVLFPVGPHVIHGQMAYPEAGSARGAVVIAGPHPLLGGNMQNNVVTCLGDGLAREGLLTLRFDYRGVGRSKGPLVDITRHLAEFWKTSHAPGEMDFWQDVQGAVEFIRQTDPSLPLSLAGYSFGCALLSYVRPQEDVASVVLVAPTVSKHDYNPFRSVTSPLLVVASEDDFATDSQRLDDWFGTLAMPRQLVRQKCDNHFFRGHEDWLIETIIQFQNAAGSEAI